MKLSSTNGVVAITALVPIFVICTIVRRFHFGADITDESFYLATTRSIIEWGGPFVMNINVTQLSSLITVPFLSLFRCFSPEDSSLIMASRYLYLFMTAATAACVYDFARRRTATPIAILLSASSLAWMPFSLPACSYNTFATSLLTVGLLLMVAPPMVSARRGIFASALFFLSIIGYPTLIVPVVGLYGGLFLAGAKNNQRENLIKSFVVLIGLFIAFTALLLAFEGTEPISHCIAWTRMSVESNRSSKLTFWLSQFEHTGLVSRLILAIASGLFIYRFPALKLRIPATLILLATLLYAAFVRSAPVYYQSHEVILLLVASAVFCFLKLEWREDRNVAIAFWASAFAGLISHVTGTNGLLNFAIGATPAALIALVYLCRSLQKWPFLSWVVPLCITAGMVFDFSTTIYGEWTAENADINYKIRQGVFKGIFTTQERGKLITDLQKDLKPYSNPNSTIYIIGAPGYYLLSKQKALDPYLYHVNDRPSQVPVMQKFFASEKHRPDVVVHVFSDAYFGKLHAADEDLLNRGYSKVKANARYAIYNKINSTLKL